MSTTPSPGSTAGTPDLGDIQKLVTRGYNFNFSWHLILTLQDPVDARKFLRQLADDGWLVGADESWVNIEKRCKREQSMPCALSLGITFEGLQKLKTNERRLDVLRDKAPAFAQGAYHRAASQLGDVEGSAPDKWEVSFRPDKAHLLLVLHANTEKALKKAEDELKKMAGEKAFEKEWARHEAAHLTTDPKNRTVHFGMRDGLSNPKILYEGPEPTERGEQPDPVHNRHRLGEFVLGYDNNDGVNPWRLPAERPASSRIPAAEQSKELADFFKNGSFAAFRKMQQHEAGFRTFVQKQATTLQGKHNLQDAEAFIRAKLLGRWDDGKILQAKDTMVSGPTGPAATANFDFTGDQAGQGCPFGAHIRRMNPRDDPVVPFRRRPILRRGMPYGEPYNRENYKKNDGEGYDYKDDGENRGLIGLFFCASLEHQFEHLVGQWANDTPMGTNNRGNARDPLIGLNDLVRHVYDIPLSDTTALALRGLTPFVTTKGTLYAFFPSLSAVKQLAEPLAPDAGTNRLYPCETGPASP